MQSHPRFENPPALPHDVVVEVLERALGDRAYEFEASSVLVGSALNDGDREFVEHWCVQVGTRAQPTERDRPVDHCRSGLVEVSARPAGEAAVGGESAEFEEHAG